LGFWFLGFFGFLVIWFFGFCFATPVSSPIHELNDWAVTLDERNTYRNDGRTVFGILGVMPERIIMYYLN